MEHTLRLSRINIRPMGVFMTASQANRERVFALLRLENEQMYAQFNPMDNEISTWRRGKPLMFETGHPSISDCCDGIQSNASWPGCVSVSVHGSS
jgi:hypothetical protein